MRILVTGANGFVGSACCARFTAAGSSVVAAVRRAPATPLAAAATVVVGEVDGATDWSAALRDIDAVVHLVAVTHGTDIDVAAAYPRYARTNVDGTRALAEQACAAGVRRFVLLSSIKVNGESTLAPPVRVPVFAPGDPALPRDNYGRSKLAAEQAVVALAGAAFQPVILRPPLVYGAGQRGNLARLMQWVAAGRPLPFAGIDNRRSLIHVGNLADALHLAATRPGLSVPPLPLADIDLSTAELVRAMATALAVPARLFTCPPWLLRALALHPRGQAMLERLCGSLLVDATAARELLGWTPRVDLASAMREAAQHWRLVRA